MRQCKVTTNKIDEIAIELDRNKIEIAVFTETWLSQNIPSKPLNINGYDLLRNDRDGKQGGGVCVYIKQDIPYKRVLLDNQDKEIIWINTNPKRMPRDIPNMTIAGVYHSPHEQPPQQRH